MNRKNYLLAFILCVQTLFVSAQVYPVRAKLTDEKSFSMILLPDPQSYTKFDANQPLFELQTAWVANSIESLNIKGVLCTGDLVEQNEIRIPDGVNGNQTSEEQWRAASRAFERLDGKLPYVICTGNHDYGYQKAENRLCHFPDYFPAERNSCWRKSLVAVGNNYQGIPTLENAAYEFITDTWGKILVVSLEFAPRDEALAWAKKVVDAPRYKDHKVILLTGKNVPQMMFNAQTADKQWFGNGGDGWLRIMEFMPDGKTIKIKTFSPLFALSPLTCDKSWRTDSYDQFDITIE